MSGSLLCAKKGVLPKIELIHSKNAYEFGVITPGFLDRCIHILLMVQTHCDKTDAYRLGDLSWNDERKDLGTGTPLFAIIFVSALSGSLVPSCSSLLLASVPHQGRIHTSVLSSITFSPSQQNAYLINQGWFLQNEILQIYTNLWKTEIFTDSVPLRITAQFFRFKKTTCQSIFFLLYLFDLLSFLELSSSQCSFILS